MDATALRNFAERLRATDPATGAAIEALLAERNRLRRALTTTADALRKASENDGIDTLWYIEPDDGPGLTFDEVAAAAEAALAGVRRAGLRMADADGWIAFEDRWPDEGQVIHARHADGSTSETSIWMETDSSVLGAARLALWSRCARGPMHGLTHWKPRAPVIWKVKEPAQDHPGG